MKRKLVQFLFSLRVRNKNKKDAYFCFRMSFYLFWHCVRKVAERRTEAHQPPRVVVECVWNENNTGSWDEWLAHLCVRLYRKSDSWQVLVYLYWDIQVTAMQPQNAKERKPSDYCSWYPLYAIRHCVADRNTLFILPSLCEICRCQTSMHTPQTLHDSSSHGARCKVNAGDFGKITIRNSTPVAKQHSSSG